MQCRYSGSVSSVLCYVCSEYRVIDEMIEEVMNVAGEESMDLNSWRRRRNQQEILLFGRRRHKKNRVWELVLGVVWKVCTLAGKMSPEIRFGGSY